MDKGNLKDFEHLAETVFRIEHGCDTMMSALLRMKSELKGVKVWMKGQIRAEDLKNNHEESLDVTQDPLDMTQDESNASQDDLDTSTFILPLRDDDSDAEDRTQMMTSRSSNSYQFDPQDIVNDFNEVNNSGGGGDGQQKQRQTEPQVPGTSSGIVAPFQRKRRIGRKRVLDRKAEDENIRKRIKQEVLEQDDISQSQEMPKPKRSSEDPRPFECLFPDCTKRFKTQAALDSHEAYHRNPNIPCYYCDKMFKSDIALDSHIRNNHRKELTHLKHKCRVCGDYFSRKKSLEKHNLEKHVGLSCSKCENVFYSWPALRSHLKSFHLVCPNNACGQTQFMSKEALLAHQRKYHAK